MSQEKCPGPAYSQQQSCELRVPRAREELSALDTVAPPKADSNPLICGRSSLSFAREGSPGLRKRAPVSEARVESTHLAALHALGNEG